MLVTVAPIPAAPELLKGVPNATCDAYSLAMIFAEMVTGVHPLPKRLRSRAATAGPPKPDLLWLAPADRAVIARALDADPDARFQNCGELLDALSGPGEGDTQATAAAAVNVPFIRPLAGLFGGEQRAVGTPSINRIVTRIVLAETSAVSLGIAQKLPFLERPDNVLESKFPIRMLPGMFRLKVDGFCAKWDAKVVAHTERAVVLRLQESGTFLQRCFGFKAGLDKKLSG